MPNTWKQAERDTAEAFGLLRMPSNGHVQADAAPAIDLATGKPLKDFTFEVKSRDIASFPKWLEGAFDQARLHPKLHNTIHGFVMLNVRYGRGRPQRWFLCIEAYPKSDDPIEQRRIDLLKAREQIEAELSALETEEKAA